MLRGSASPPASDRTVDRRSLLKAGAWAAPAIVVAAAVPAAAASVVGTNSVTVGATPTVNALNGNRVSVAVSGTAAQSITITGVLKVTPKPGSAAGSWDDGTAGSVSKPVVVNVAAGQSATLTLPTYKKHDANAQYTFELLVTWGDQGQFSAVRTGSF